MIHVLGNSLFIYVAVGVVCTVLALLVIAILYLIRVKQSKGKENHVCGRGSSCLQPLLLEHQSFDAEIHGCSSCRKGRTEQNSQGVRRLRGKLCLVQNQKRSVLLVPKTPDATLHLLLGTRKSPAPNEAKLLKNVAACL